MFIDKLDIVLQYLSSTLNKTIRKITKNHETQQKCHVKCFK